MAIVAIQPPLKTRAATHGRAVEPYSFSFLTGALYLPESIAVGELALKQPD
jgi:plasmid stability protein